MISSDDTDLMGWNSPSNPPITRKLPQPLIPAIDVQSPTMVNNPFDDVCEKIVGEIQNPFDEICSLVEQQTVQPCQKDDNEVNLLNMTVAINTIDSKEDVENLNTSSIPELNTSTLGEMSILNISSLDDNLLLLQDNVADNMLIADKNTSLHKENSLDSVRETCKVQENNNFLSQSQCDYSQAEVSLNDSFFDHGQRYHELCSKLDSSFNRSKSEYDQIMNHDKEAVAKYKRRSVESSFMRQIEDEEKKAVEKALSTSQTLNSKSVLKPWNSPNLRLKSCSSLKALPTLSVKKDSKSGPSSRQGPMKALAPLKSMIKSSNNLTDKTESMEKTKDTSMFKSSFHKSPIKTLKLRTKSAPRLTSSTPEKSFTPAHSSFSSPSPLKYFPSKSPSPLKSVATSPIKSLESKLKSLGISPLKATSIKTLGLDISPLRSFRTNPILSSRTFKCPTSSNEKSHLKVPLAKSQTKIPASPLRTLSHPNTSFSNSLKLSARRSVSRSMSTSQLKLDRSSPLKSTSANVGGAIDSSVAKKPRSSSLSRLKAPWTAGEIKASRFNVSHKEKENMAVQFVL